MSTERTAKIEEAASEWLIHRDSGDWTADDQRRLDEWLNESTLHRMAFWRLELAWEDAARLKALGAGVRGDRPPPPGQWNLTPFFSPPAPGEHRPRLRSWRLAGFAASAAALALLGGTTWYVWPVGDGYSTPVGGIASVPMKDGSKVTLNTNTSVRITVTATERHVDLKRGEAYFEVAKDPQRPFVVQVGDKRVIAVGTQFSVRRDTDDVQVVVSEGKVQFDTGPGVDKSASNDVLTPGTVARASDDGVLVQRKTRPEVDESLSWRSGVLMFRNETLGDAVAEFNRYNTQQIVIEDPAIGALKIEGNFRATNVDAFVRLLEGGFPIQATQDSERVVLKAR
jgi:transmembrane sensor